MAWPVARMVSPARRTPAPAAFTSSSFTSTARRRKISEMIFFFSSSAPAYSRIRAAPAADRPLRQVLQGLGAAAPAEDVEKRPGELLPLLGAHGA